VRLAKKLKNGLKRRRKTTILLLNRRCGTCLSEGGPTE